MLFVTIQKLILERALEMNTINIILTVSAFL